MKLYKLLLPALSIFIFSCNNEPASTLNNILNQDQLASQLFNVNIHTDTTLVTEQGCIIKIPKQSLESDSNNVKLEIKEALTMEQIVLAGLTTMSGKQALSSGGMIYINAASGYKVSIKKQLEVLVPTKTYNPDMNVFKGEKDEDGKIDWKDPQSLPKDETNAKIDAGEVLFKSYCANCHKILADFTGPALYGITDRRSKEWLYNFTRYSLLMKEGPTTTKVSEEKPGKIITDTSIDEYNYQSYDFYSECLFNHWGRTVMPAYSNLKDEDLDALYSYIKTESDKRPDLKEKYKARCCDSCEAYHNAMQQLQIKKEKLIDQNETFFNLNRTIPTSVTPNTTVAPSVIDTIDFQPEQKVMPAYAKATYYTINIQATGWHNIDMLLSTDNTNTQSELFVRIQGSYKIDVNLVLVIPSKKVFVEGGKLDDGQQYGFDETNGKIYLPKNLDCYVMAFAEYNNKIVFGKASFISQEKQIIDITLLETTRDSMKAQIKALNLDGVQTEVKETKNAKEIRDTDLKMKETEKLKPKNCNCDGNTLPAADSTKLALLTK